MIRCTLLAILLLPPALGFGANDETEQNKQLIRQFIEDVQDFQVTDFSKYFASYFEGVDVGSVRNKSGKKYLVVNPDVNRRIENFRRAFPDVRVELHQLIAEGNKVVAEVSFTGTQKGSFIGIAPTDKPVVIRAMKLFTVEGGKITRIEELQNSLSWMRQLGTIVIDRT